MGPFGIFSMPSLTPDFHGMSNPQPQFVAPPAAIEAQEPEKAVESAPTVTEAVPAPVIEKASVPSVEDQVLALRTKLADDQTTEMSATTVAQSEAAAEAVIADSEAITEIKA